MTETSIPHHLKKVDPNKFNIRRVKWGRGYRYLNGNNKPIVSHRILDMVKNIPVPDTWNDVTLSRYPDSYILARGYDGSEKLQYLYHPDFISYRNEQKFAHLLEFGLILPKIRRGIYRDMRQQEWTEKKLFALIVKILDKYHMRIGSRIYAKKNRSFGLTTLRKKHLKELDEHTYSFEYTGKSRQQVIIDLNDPELVRLMGEIADFPGWELFSFSTGQGRISANPVKINGYIRQLSGLNFSAHTFRTWAGTVSAVEFVNKAKQMARENPKRKISAIIVELVAEKLGNTAAVCKEFYIHPAVLEEVVRPGFKHEPCEEKFIKNKLYRKCECRTLEILSKL